jgi:pimeloyl-ACP methyl ester carboxylesterase
MVKSILALLAMATSVLADDAPSRFASVDGVRVHYESYGESNEALVFIHGWTCDLTFWRGQEPVYSAHRSLLVDLPGHGQSGKPRIPYPTEFFARAVEAVMKDAGVDRAVLIGHSLGGNIAYTFVRMFPQKVKSIVFVDASATRPVFAPSPQTRALYQKRAHNLSGPAGEKNFVRQVNAMFSDRTPPGMRAEIRSKMLATPEYVRVAAVTSFSKLPPADRNESFDIPALAILASFLPERVSPMRSIFPNLQVEKWDEYGHFLMMEDLERFNSTLETFLADHP